MEYSVNKLAKLAGISTRTLRYYDEIGLLSPARINSNGYRIYCQTEVDTLQQILFYRELGMPLDEIKKFILSKNFDSVKSLKNHLSALLAKREQLDLLISNVEKSIKAMKGEITMNDKEKFSGFIRNLVDDNEQQYGEEIRSKYGNDVINSSNKKVTGMTKEQYSEIENLSFEVNETLKLAFEQGDITSELAKKVYELHKKWLCYYWDSYSKEAHIGVAQMYVDDSRFAEYYDKITFGCATFLRDIILYQCEYKENAFDNN